MVYLLAVKAAKLGANVLCPTNDLYATFAELATVLYDIVTDWGRKNVN
jgi:hypothetical protein